MICHLFLFVKMSVHTIIVDGYNVKFTNDGKMVKVSIPNCSCTIDLTSQNKHLDNIFTNKLLSLEWTAVAIAKLEEHILLNDMWYFCNKMDIKTGDIKMV